LSGAAVDDHAGARLSDTSQIEELAVLTKRDFAGRSGCAENDSDAIADAVEQLRAARRELFGRKDLVPTEHRLRKRDGSERHQAE
jgi:hypothetical protein